jgi:hypothetical protein
LQHGMAVEIESDDWLEETLLLSMEVTLCAEVESDLKGLPANHRGAITMLRFIIKRLVVQNQEVWDALEEYIKTFDICNFPSENVPTTCLKLKAVLNVLGVKTPSNAVHTILEGFAHASTANLSDVCKSKIAMRGDSVYASLCAVVPLRSQLSSMLDDLKQKYQQLITAKKWEGVRHVGMDKSSKSAFNAINDHDVEAQSYAAYIKKKGHKGFLPFKEWAKLQTCHHCGQKGHVRPRCRKYLPAKANGTLPPSHEKQPHMPVSAHPKDCHDKLQKDPKLKALLSAFSAFTTKYLAESPTDENDDAANDNNAENVTDVHDDDDDLNPFLGMVGALKE